MEEIKFDKRNYRKHDKKNKSLIKKSLEKFGAGRSIVVDAEGEIIGGNGVYEQAQKLGLKTKIVETDGSELVVVKRTDLKTDDEKRKALAVMDNSTSDTSEFNLELLTADFSVDELQDFGIELPEEEEEQKKEVKEVEVPEQVESRCKLGDLWKLGNHRLICGDSTNFDNYKLLMKDDIADMTFTSPPYNVGKKHFSGNKKYKYENYEDDLNEKEYTDLLINFSNCCLSKSKYIFVNIQSLTNNKLSIIDYVYKLRDKYVDVIIWNKNSAIPCIQKNVLSSQFEYIYIFRNSNKNNKKIELKPFEFEPNVWNINKQINNEYSNIHSATMPITLAEKALKTFCLNSVVDPFAGTGTTLIVAEQLGIKSYNIELDPHYCDVIIQRWENLTGKKAELITDAD